MERKITIEEETEYKEDYQMRMLMSNEIIGILPVRGRGFNGRSCYDYNVSGKISMRAMYERNEISAKDIKIFLECLSMALEEVQKYLLDIHCILLNPEYIFYEEEQFYFCYYPPKTSELWKDMHELTEYFVKHADYQEDERKETRENEDREMQKKEVQNRRNLWEKEEVWYDTREHDWIAEQEMGSLIMEETENLWTPVRRFLRKHKKPRWGEWDDLHIEEEEL